MPRKADPEKARRLTVPLPEALQAEILKVHETTGAPVSHLVELVGETLGLQVGSVFALYASAQRRKLEEAERRLGRVPLPQGQSVKPPRVGPGDPLPIDIHDPRFNLAGTTEETT